MHVWEKSIFTLRHWYLFFDQELASNSIWDKMEIYIAWGNFVKANNEQVKIHQHVSKLSTEQLLKLIWLACRIKLFSHCGTEEG